MWRRRGSGLAGTFIGMTILLAVILTMITTMDYAMYSYKRLLISKAIDKSVLAALQEIDTASSSGIAKAYDPVTGIIKYEDIVVNETSADNAFYSTLKNNYNIAKSTIQDKIMIIIIYPLSNGNIKYIIRKGSGLDLDTNNGRGEIATTTEIEALINNRINSYYNNADLVDHSTIKINGNTLVNQFQKEPYYMVILKDFEINGILQNRKATFVGFKGSAIKRY
jgi:hypothetical protein